MIKKLITKIKQFFNSNSSISNDKSRVEYNNKSENESNRNTTFPDYSHLKKSLLGKDNFLFLVNDVNNELRQHFDENYKNKFNAEKFKESYESKKNYCKKRKIDYRFFIIPDKCLVCQEKLPFETNFIKRNYNDVSDLFPDFISKLQVYHYYVLDSHLNYLGGKALSYLILNNLDSNITWNKFRKLFSEQMSKRRTWRRRGDLTLDPNFSYTTEDLENITETTHRFHRRYLKSKDIPKEFAYTMKGMKLDRIGSPYLYLKDSTIRLLQKLGFRQRDTRETLYFKNPKSYTDKKVLVFRDSGTTRVYPGLTTYFNETLLYWDHWNFNKDLIKWYNPDIILEIRTERFIDLPDFEVV